MGCETWSVRAQAGVLQPRLRWGLERGTPNRCEALNSWPHAQYALAEELRGAPSNFTWLSVVAEVANSCQTTSLPCFCTHIT